MKYCFILRLKFSCFSFIRSMASHGLLLASGSKFDVFVVDVEEDGLLGLQGSDIVCFTCEQQASNCEHVDKLRTSEKEPVFKIARYLCWETFQGFISSIYDRDHAEGMVCKAVCKENFISVDCLSKASILMIGGGTECKLTETSNDGLVTLIPEFLSIALLFVPSVWLSYCERCSRQVSCFLKKTVVRFEGKEKYFFFTLVRTFFMKVTKTECISLGSLVTCMSALNSIKPQRPLMSMPSTLKTMKIYMLQY